MFLSSGMWAAAYCLGPGYYFRLIMKAVVADTKVALSDNLDFLRAIESESVKLIISSPPYNLGKEYEQKEPLPLYVEWQDRVIAECLRVLHPQGSICWQVGNFVHNGEVVPLDIVLYESFRSRGMKLRNRIIWKFGHGLHCSRRLSGRYETINWWTKTDSYTWHLDPIRMPSKYPDKRHFKGPNAGQPSGNPLGKNPTDVWDIPNVKSNHPEKTVHPCQFPVELAERLVLALSDPGDIVMDPHMGVGSVLIAAIKHGRIAYGCDIFEKYVDVANHRIAEFEAGTLRLRPMGRPVYDPRLPGGGYLTKPAPSGPALPFKV